MSMFGVIRPAFSRTSNQPGSVVQGGDKMYHWGAALAGNGAAVNRPCFVQSLHFPPKPYLSTCWLVQRLTSRSLASSCWLTPFDRSVLMYSRRCSVRLGRRPGERPSVRAFASPATERSLGAVCL